MTHLNHERRAGNSLRGLGAKLVLLLALIGQAAGASPIGTAFTYQGQLQDSGAAANGTYDLRFSLFDALTNGNQVGPFATNSAVAVSNGYFVATVDFGLSVFSNNALWLAIGVRTNGPPGHFYTLTPRQPLTPVPFALFGTVLSSITSITSVTNIGTLFVATNSENPTNVVLTMPTGQIVLGQGGGGNAASVIWITNSGHLHFDQGEGGAIGMDMWWNPNHSTEAEFQMASSGRIALAPGYNQGRKSAIQLGAPGYGTLAYIAEEATPNSGSPLGNSQALNFATYYGVAGVWLNLYSPGFRAFALNTNGPTDPNGWVLRVGNFPFVDWGNLTNINQLDMGLVGLDIYPQGIAPHGRVTTDLSPVVQSGTNYGVNFDAGGVELQVHGPLNLTNVTGFYPRTNQSTELKLRIYALSQCALRTPTNWTWINEAGTATAPTNIPGSNVMVITIQQDIGALTNYLAEYKLGTWSH